MALLIIALFLVLPFVELALIVAAAESFGLGTTFVALVLFSVAGGWLMRTQGWAVWRRANQELAAGRLPARELLDGAMVLGGGALLLTPGFLTDLVGLLLLLPPVRAVLRPVFLRWMARRATASAARVGSTGTWVGGGATGAPRGFGGMGFPPGTGPFDATVVDATVVDADAPGPGRPAPSARVIRVEPLSPEDGPGALDTGS